MNDYNDWVNNEYSLWESALSDLMSNEDKFSTFRKHPQVKRMMSDSSLSDSFQNSFVLFHEQVQNMILPWKKISEIDQIGSPDFNVDINSYKISNVCLRFIYYIDKILNILQTKNEIKIVEIGGGYGGMAAIFDILAKDREIKIDEYAIFDLPLVQKFQQYYLNKCNNEISNNFGIQSFSFLDSKNIELFNNKYNYCISFYSLGELPKEIRAKYLQYVLQKTEHGFIIWNPHYFDNDESGQELLKKYKPNIQISVEDPLTSVNNLQLIF